MKKVLTILLAVAMLASLACVGASAKVLVTDPFNTYGPDNNNLWLWTRPEPTDDEKLVEIDGNNWLMLEIVVEQSKFTSDEDSGIGCTAEGNVLKTGTWWVDMMTEYKDGEVDGGAGLWFANYGHQHEDGAGDQDTYYLKYYPKESVVKFYYSSPELPEVEEGQEDPSILATYVVPGAPGETAPSKTALKLGFRVDAGKISAFVGDTCIGSREDATIGMYHSPMLLWNDGGLRTYFDNYCVGDLDELPLEKKDDTTAPDDTAAPTDTGEDNSDSVADDTTTAAPAPADTNTNPPSAANGGSQTGDMAVVVLAIMVASLGSAIVVKKVSDK